MPALDRLKPMPFANMLVQRRGGRVTAYAAGVNEGHGHGQFPEKYAKFAYDCGFAVPNFAPCHGENVENHTAEAHCSTLRCAVQGGGEPVVMGGDNSWGAKPHEDACPGVEKGTAFHFSIQKAN